MNVRIKWLLVAIALANAAAVMVADEPEPADRLITPAVGDPLPAFENADDQGTPWISADHVGKKVLVLYFYPGDFTSGCIKQAEAYRDGLAKIEALGVELVGVSGDDVATHKLFKETFSIKHALLADPKGELATLMGVPMRGGGGKARAMDAERRPLLDAAGSPIILNRPATIARWTLVVGRDGRIASLRNILNPATDIEEVFEIVATLPK